MKSQNSIWVIAVLGLVSMVAFSGLGFWNVKHPLLQVRPYLQQRHQVSVEKTTLKRDKRGRLDAVEIIVTEPEDLDEERLRRMGCDAFAWFCDKDDRNDIRRVIVQAPNGRSATVTRSEVELFRNVRSKPVVDGIRRAVFRARRASPNEIVVLQTDADGTDVLVKIQIKDGKNDDARVPADVARRVRSAVPGLLDLVEVQVLDQKEAVLSWTRYDRRNKATKLPVSGS